MKILVVYRTEKDFVGKSVKNIAESLKKQGHEVDLVSRNEDLNFETLSSSMEGLKGFILKINEKENYDIIYTQDWSIAMPLLIPSKVLFEKHYCLFHDIEPSSKSKIFQKIVGNMLGNKLLVKTKELKEKFPKAIPSKNGLEVLDLKK